MIYHNKRNNRRRTAPADEPSSAQDTDSGGQSKISDRLSEDIDSGGQNKITDRLSEDIDSGSDEHLSDFYF